MMKYDVSINEVYEDGGEVSVVCFTAIDLRDVCSLVKLMESTDGKSLTIEISKVVL